MRFQHCGRITYACDYLQTFSQIVVSLLCYRVFELYTVCIERVQAADLLHSGGELQAQLDDPVLDGVEVTDACQRCPDRGEYKQGLISTEEEHSCFSFSLWNASSQAWASSNSVCIGIIFITEYQDYVKHSKGGSLLVCLSKGGVASFTVYLSGRGEENHENQHVFLMYLSSQASIHLAAPISSTTAVRNSLGGLFEVLLSCDGLLLLSEAQFCRLLEAALIRPTKVFRFSVSMP